MIYKLHQYIDAVEGGSVNRDRYEYICKNILLVNPDCFNKLSRADMFVIDVITQLRYRYNENNAEKYVDNKAFVALMESISNNSSIDPSALGMDSNIARDENGRPLTGKQFLELVISNHISKLQA